MGQFNLINFFCDYIGMGTIDCDFSYSYDKKDYLERPFSKLRQFTLLSDIISILFSKFYNGFFSFIILVLNFLVKIIIEVYLTAHWNWYTR